MTSSAGGASPHRRYRLSIVVTHPIQYFAPWFGQLADHPQLELQVIYLRQLDAEAQGLGFGRSFAWDVPLLDGYTSETLDAPLQPVASLRWVPSLARALRAFKPDAVLVTGWQEPLLAAAIPLSRWLGMPVILRGEANALRSRGLLARLAHRAIVVLTSAAVAIGRSNRDFYTKASSGRLPVFDGAYFVEIGRAHV